MAILTSAAVWMLGLDLSNVSSLTKAEAVKHTSIKSRMDFLGLEKLTETVRASTCVVGAAITTSCGKRRSTRVLGSNYSNILCQSRINVISIDSQLVAWREASHVLVEHSKDCLPGGFIVGEDCLGPKKSAFFTTIPMKLDCVLWNKV